MKHLFTVILLLFIVISPVIADKSKGLFSGEILQADLDSFTSNVSETPIYLSDNQSGVQSNPQDTQDWMDIGKTQLKSGNWKPAEETFSKVIEKDPNNTDGWEGYLLAIRGGGNYDELLDASERATKENPGFASAWKYDGIALSSLDRSDEALVAFDKALEADPKYYDALYYKGVALDSLKKYSESVKTYEDVLVLNPKYTKAWNNKGVALMYTGKYDEAITAFDNALSIDPEYKKASDNKGQAVREKSKKSLGSVVTIDDGAVFVPSSSDSDSGEAASMITVSPTKTPVVNSETHEIQRPEMTLSPTHVSNQKMETFNNGKHVLYDGEISLPTGIISVTADSGLEYEIGSDTPLGVLALLKKEGKISELNIYDGNMGGGNLLILNGIGDYRFGEQGWFVKINNVTLQEYINPDTDGLNIRKVKSGDKLGYYFGIQDQMSSNANAAIYVSII